MDASGVLVSCSAVGSTAPRWCSGIRVHRDWVLTTGGILSDILQENMTWKSVLNTAHEGHVVHMQDGTLSFSVITSYVANTMNQMTSTNKHLEGTLTPANKQFRTLGIPKSEESVRKRPSATAAVCPLPSNTCATYEEFAGVLKYLWRSPLVSEAVDAMLSSWVVGGTSRNCNDNTESDLAKCLLSLFLMLKLQADTDSSSDVNEYNVFVDLLHDMFGQEEEVLRRGQAVVVESTPFGNHCFHNSVSEGVISNVIGPGRCLLLTDASTALGSEGGPIFVTAHRDGELQCLLVGMVICSLSWWRGEWVGFTLGVALQPVVRRLLVSGVSLSNSSVSLASPDTSSDLLAGVDDRVVLVRCGFNWGSGVVVGARDGIILTCSHVVRNARNGEVQVCWNNKTYAATVLFRSRDGVAYDVAVLKTGPGPSFHSVNFSSKVAVKGEPVIAAGFSLFSEDDNVRPTVTRGVVAHVSDPVAVLQTTCCVQSGASGGALFRCTGDLLGIISCNTVDTNTGALFPRINMAVPMSAVADSLNAFLLTGDVQILSGLESKDPVVQRLWKLQTTVSKL